MAISFTPACGRTRERSRPSARRPARGPCPAPARRRRASPGRAPSPARAAWSACVPAPPPIPAPPRRVSSCAAFRAHRVGRTLNSQPSPYGAAPSRAAGFVATTSPSTGESSPTCLPPASSVTAVAPCSTWLPGAGSSIPSIVPIIRCPRSSRPTATVPSVLQARPGVARVQRHVGRDLEPSGGDGARQLDGLGDHGLHGFLPTVDEAPEADEEDEVGDGQSVLDELRGVPAEEFVSVHGGPWWRRGATGSGSGRRRRRVRRRRRRWRRSWCGSFHMTAFATDGPTPSAAPARRKSRAVAPPWTTPPAGTLRPLNFRTVSFPPRISARIAPNPAGSRRDPLPHPPCHVSHRLDGFLDTPWGRQSSDRWATTVNSPSSSTRTDRSMGRQHTEQSSTYLCDAPPPRSTSTGTSSPQ